MQEDADQSEERWSRVGKVREPISSLNTVGKIMCLELTPTERADFTCSYQKRKNSFHE